MQQLPIDIEIVGIKHRIYITVGKIYLRPSRQVALIVDVGQIVAITECITADAWHSVRDCDACQIAATIECITADACHAVRNRDTRQIVAIVECIIAYLFRAFGDNNFSLQQLPIDIEIIGIKHRIYIIVGKIYLRPSLQVALIVDVRQAAAAGECPIADACHAVSNRDAC